MAVFANAWPPFSPQKYPVSRVCAGLSERRFTPQINRHEGVTRKVSVFLSGGSERSGLSVIVDGEVRSELALFVTDVNDCGRECVDCAQPKSRGRVKSV